jgi:hypothetical protein
LAGSFLDMPEEAYADVNGKTHDNRTEQQIAFVSHCWPNSKQDPARLGGRERARGMRPREAAT